MIGRRRDAFSSGGAQGLAAMDARGTLVAQRQRPGQLALIRAGCGIGVCQVGIAKRDPNLVRMLGRHFEFKLPTWVVMHEDLRGSTRCKTTFDALVRALSSQGAA
jgi:hypothetical protein